MAAFAIVYLSQFVLRDVSITFFSAILTAILLTVTEYFQHNYLIKTDKTKKDRRIAFSIHDKLPSLLDTFFLKPHTILI